MLFETLWVWAVDGAGTAAHVYEVKALPEPYTHMFGLKKPGIIRDWLELPGLHDIPGHFISLCCGLPHLQVGF